MSSPIVICGPGGVPRRTRARGTRHRRRSRSTRRRSRSTQWTRRGAPGLRGPAGRARRAAPAAGTPRVGGGVEPEPDTDRAQLLPQRRHPRRRDLQRARPAGSEDLEGHAGVEFALPTGQPLAGERPERLHRLDILGRAQVARHRAHRGSANRDQPQDPLMSRMLLWTSSGGSLIVWCEQGGVDLAGDVDIPRGQGVKPQRSDWSVGSGRRWSRRRAGRWQGSGAGSR